MDCFGKRIEKTDAMEKWFKHFSNTMDLEL